MTEVVRPSKRSRVEKGDGEAFFMSEPGLPCLDISTADFSTEVFLKSYDIYQAVYLPNIFLTGSEDGKLTWKELGDVYHNLSKDDQASWCLETAGGTTKPISQEFLQPQITNHVAYCSFLVQKDEASFAKILERLPMQDLPWNNTSWKYEPCLWIFFGRNPSSESDLQGRSEHTDSVSHDGTWHYQLSGTKRWFLRPSSKLIEQMKTKMKPDEANLWTESTKLRIDCNEGDVLVVNTRLWNHQTMIPPQQFPSVSYARDFWLKNHYGGNEEACAPGTMSNMDGLYATNDIDEGTIIFTENEMPGCELHRSATNANCEVVELEDGTSAVVSSRAIAAGEFFCVPESSDEDEFIDGDEDEDDA